MTNRIPMFAAGALAAALVAGGITYSTAGTGDTNLITKSRDGYSINIDEGATGYDLLAAYVKCPRGTQMTGGGYADFTTDGITYYSAPDIEGTEGWFAATIASDGQDASSLIVSVTCMGPSGKFGPAFYRQATASAIPEHMVEYAREHMPAR